MSAAHGLAQLKVTLIGGPTVVFSYAGLTIVTDPTLSEPGEYDGLIKTAAPAVSAVDLGAVDVVLASHHHHADNLDPAGREVARHARWCVTTAQGATALGFGHGLLAAESTVVGDDRHVHITAVEALHGPQGIAEHLGPVVGFVLRSAGWPTVYFSGDNASTSAVRRIGADHPDVDVAIVCMGGARVERLGDALLTFDGAGAAVVGEVWPDAAIVPVHADGWAHFSQSREAGIAQLSAAGLASATVDLVPGRAVAIVSPSASPIPGETPRM